MTVEETTRTSIEIIEDLEQLSHTEGFVYAFSGLVVRSLWMPESELGIVNWAERLNSQELSFLLGLMVKRPIAVTHIPLRNYLKTLSWYHRRYHMSAHASCSIAR